MEDERCSSLPSSAGELVTGAFSIYTRHFALLVGMAAVFLLPGPAVRLLGSAAAAVLAVPLQFVLSSAGRLVLIDVASQLCLGSPPSLRHAIARVSVGSVGGLIGTTLLASAITMLGLLGPLILWVPAFFVTERPMLRILFGVPFFLLGLGLAINFLVDYFLVGPVVVLERTYGRAALHRSAALSGEAFWRTIAVALVAVAFGVGLLAVAIVLRLPVMPHVGRGSAATMAVVGVFVTPFTTALSTLYYHSRRAEHGETLVRIEPEPEVEPLATTGEEATE